MDAPSEIGRSVRAHFFTPILPYLASALVAFFFAGTSDFRGYCGLFFRVGTAAVLLEVTLRFFYACCGFSVRGFSKCAVSAIRFVGVFSLCVWYFYFRVPENPYPNFAPRYAELTLRLDEVSRGMNDSRYGTATVLSAPVFAEKTVGRKIWYTISDGRNAVAPNKNFTVSETVRVCGVLAGTYPDEPKSRGFSASKPEGRAFEKYLRDKGVHFKISARSAGTASLAKPESRYAFFEAVRGYMERSLSAYWFGAFDGSESAATYKAMILGDKSLLTPEQKLAFADTGTMHVFAISGLHIGFAAAVLFGAGLVLLPPLLPSLPGPEWLTGRKTALYLAVETALLLLLLLVCVLSYGGTWFPGAAMGCLFGLSLIFAPEFLRQLPLPPFFRDRKLTLYLAVETALFLLLLLVCQLAYGGDWLITFMVVHPLPLHDCGSRVSTNHSSSEPAHHLLYLETPDWC